MLTVDPGPTINKKTHSRLKIWLIGAGSILLIALVVGLLWLRNYEASPREAPEAERVLTAQTELPFQVLIPAYLPGIFSRQQMQVNTSDSGPNGEQMVELVYPTRHGDKLSFYEWLPAAQDAETQRPYCSCVCKSHTQCSFSELGMSIGTLRVLARVSSLDLVTAEEARAIVDTLGPAVNRQVYSSLKDVSVTYSVPPATEVPIDSNGIQEVTLIVTPNGYMPAHFAVKKDVPVRLTFRQVGYVGCGNQLIIEYGRGKTGTITLASAGDAQVLEFTPSEAGDFSYHCPHLIYRGVMTVNK